MKYDVHVYATVRVMVPGIEAESQEEAIKTAQAQLDNDQTLYELFDHPENEVVTSYAEEITGYLVDETGDESYERTTFYDAKGVQQYVE